MLFTGWEVRMVKNCERGLENIARGRRTDPPFIDPVGGLIEISTNLFFGAECIS